MANCVFTDERSLLRNRFREANNAGACWQDQGRRREARPRS